jgi:hypothetical protein
VYIAPVDHNVYIYMYIHIGGVPDEVGTEGKLPYLRLVALPPPFPVDRLESSDSMSAESEFKKGPPIYSLRDDLMGGYNIYLYLRSIHTIISCFILLRRKVSLKSYPPPRAGSQLESS